MSLYVFCSPSPTTTPLKCTLEGEVLHSKSAVHFQTCPPPLSAFINLSNT